MIGLFWNCRWVSKKGMSVIVKDILADNVVDFVGLQETMKKTYSDAFFRKIDTSKKYAWHWIPSEGKSGGILCGVNLEKFDVIHFSEGNFSLSATVQCKKREKETPFGLNIWPCS